MSYQVLARKWRPRIFDEVVGQDHIVRSLKNAIKSKNFGHAYILTGTRGIGKTSVARIFAKALRCENNQESGNPCLKCSECESFDQDHSMNVVEIDGASNNSVDNIRDLVENVQYLPTSGSHKVYIIDEVHMLSSSAFNALLKTLEEPPAHIVFIFATTEPHKVLDTILSRCQRLDFRNASLAILVDHLSKIADKEEIVFEGEHILRKICQLGNGSFRDCLSLLDQALVYTEDRKINEEIITLALGVPSAIEIKKIVCSMLEGQYEQVRESVLSLQHKNVKSIDIGRDILDLLFKFIENIKLLPKVGLLSEEFVKNLELAELVWVYETLAKDLNWIEGSIAAEKSFLVALKKITLRNQFLAKKKKVELAESSPEDVAGEVEARSELPQNISDVVNGIRAELSAQEEKEVAPPIDEPVEQEVVVAKEEKVERDYTWDSFLGFLREVSAASCSNLEQGNLISPMVFDGESLKVNLGFGETEEVFYEYLQEAETNKRIIDNIAEYFQIKKTKVELRINLLGEVEREEKNFKSKVQILEESEQKEDDRVKDEFLSDERIKSVQSLFNAKIDKVVLQNR